MVCLRMLIRIPFNGAYSNELAQQLLSQTSRNIRSGKTIVQSGSESALMALSLNGLRSVHNCTRTFHTSVSSFSTPPFTSSSSSSSSSSSANQTQSGVEPQLTHTDPETGKASMVSVTDKPATHRTATAVSSIWLPAIAFDLLKRNGHKKGDVLTVAQIAGIQAAKQTSNLIPLCHPLLLTHVSVELKLVEDIDDTNHTDMDSGKSRRNSSSYSSNNVDKHGLRGGRVEIESKVACMGNTGVEMEALTGATVAALTVFDMCKAVGKDMVIGEIKVLEKTGGKSGVYKHQQKGQDRKGYGI
ncbi:hypothetical protein BX616_002328 [Lobosporangium transversale]|uniref:cyclic pyranopterin monophosphate synthase n=1 Tax=Lobosporangium transversale TaxID=64571 RepID=A0A1Y2GRT7_9FUNG|nr:Molybdopterin cofactor biosynthesis C domain-containing protein [Lobosporangium transversale]KAF9916957.1 hypothetical protein BX616_002328 [Lobosporangium transversale]ORZ20869.1 Molybdopterin cofactor biosynthesis C domain-containing protein [Lobosporangium transversale]|eukprot:XP_021882778.1 Molybdopterin cofactor biosynthesis C domain-containing protein [Lobosporangium transversale]